MPVKISMNVHAIVSLALYGAVEKAEALYREMFRVVKEREATNSVFPIQGRAFKKVPTGVGGTPNLHDFRRWAESVVDDEEHEKDLRLFGKLYATCRSRGRPEVIQAIEEGLEH